MKIAETPPETPKPMQISKTDYMLYRRHPAWLWLKKNAPERIPPVDAAKQAIFESGYTFEPYAEALFPDGVDLGYETPEEYQTLPLRTVQALGEGATTLFQPRFKWKEFTCISDIVSVVDERTVDLYEIKASTRAKPEHIYDLAFQKAVLVGNGVDVRNVSVIHVNNQYVRRGDIDPRELTAFTDVTEEVAKLEIETLEFMHAALATARKAKIPDTNPELAKLGSKHDWMQVYEHIFPHERPKFPADTMPEIDKQAIERFLRTLKFPLYFFDYETMQSVIPYFDGQRPYQQVPFQYSVHMIREPGGEVEHTEYLHTDTTDPAPHVAARLVEDLSQKGTIITWNMNFEKSVNTELGRMHPEYSKQIEAINSRIVDLMTPFKAKWYKDARFNGSASIKNVLPVMCPDLSYKELEIHEGNSAQRIWMETVLDGKNAEQKQQILNDLSEYCKMDTWAMVRILLELVKATSK